MGTFIAICLIIIVIIGTTSGIVKAFKETFIQPKQEAKRNNRISEFKYQNFITAITSFFPNSYKVQGTENIIVYREKISNGVDNIGCFQYAVVDEMTYTENSVGKVKKHKYTITVSCFVKPSVDLLFSSAPKESLEVDECADIVLKLKSEVTNNQSYLDAIEINRIK
jgi:hypothetical protein